MEQKNINIVQNSSLSRDLNLAWLYRLNQRNDLAYELLYKIQSQIKTMEDPDVQIQISALSLEASLLRWKKQLLKAKDYLDNIGSQFSRTDVEKNYFYFFELGLYYFSIAEYMDGFDYFIKAKTLAPEEKYVFIALFNIYIISKKLEISHKKMLEDLEVSFLKIKNSTDISGIVSQYRHLQLQQHWRNADITSLDSFRNKSEGGQDLYLQIYLSKLAYLNVFSYLSSEDIVLLKKLYLSDYRIRTLTGKIHPEDYFVQDSEEVVDRIYLWFWNFLKNPKAFPLNRLTEYLVNKIPAKTNNFTPEARYKLRNIYLAISLITKVDLNHKINNFYFFSHEENKVLDLEKNIFLYLFSKSLYREDLLGEMKNNPAFVEKNIYLSSLLSEENKEDDPLYYLKKEIQPSTVNVPKTCKYIVNGKNNCLEIVADKDLSVVSKVFFDALSFLFNKEEVSCNSFFLAVCGIAEYDSFIHSKRLWNILSKLKKICKADLDYKVRDNVIYVQADWSKFFIIEKGSYLTQIQDVNFITCLDRFINLKTLDTTSDKKQLLAHKASLEVSKKESVEINTTNLLSQDLEGFVSRKDLELILNSSRSNVGRLLKLWLDQNMLVKQGKGKNTLYKLDQKLIKTLAKE